MGRAWQVAVVLLSTSFVFGQRIEVSQTLPGGEPLRGTMVSRNGVAVAFEVEYRDGKPPGYRYASKGFGNLKEGDRIALFFRPMAPAGPGREREVPLTGAATSVAFGGEWKAVEIAGISMFGNASIAFRQPVVLGNGETERMWTLTLHDGWYGHRSLGEYTGEGFVFVLVWIFLVALPLIIFAIATFMFMDDASYRPLAARWLEVFVPPLVFVRPGLDRLFGSSESPRRGADFVRLTLSLGCLCLGVGTILHQAGVHLGGIAWGPLFIAVAAGLAGSAVAALLLRLFWNAMVSELSTSGSQIDNSHEWRYEHSRVSIGKATVRDVYEHYHGVGSWAARERAVERTIGVLRVAAWGASVVVPLVWLSKQGSQPEQLWVAGVPLAALSAWISIRIAMH
jgi:hypothetical protein